MLSNFIASLVGGMFLSLAAMTVSTGAENNIVRADFAGSAPVWKAYGSLMPRLDAAAKTLHFEYEPHRNKGVSGGIRMPLGAAAGNPGVTAECTLVISGTSPSGNSQVSGMVLLDFCDASGKQAFGMTLASKRYHRERRIMFKSADGLQSVPFDFAPDAEMTLRIRLDRTAGVWCGDIVRAGKSVWSTGSQMLPKAFRPDAVRVIASTANGNDGMKIAVSNLTVNGGAAMGLPSPEAPLKTTVFKPAPGDLKAVFPTAAALKLAPGVASSSQSLEFAPIVPRAGYGIVLRFDARIATPGVGGWNPHMALELNGVKLGKYTASGTPRLLLRGLTMKSTIEPETDWWRINGEFTQLMTFFAPDSEKEVDVRMLSAREERYIYTLDVSDLVHYALIGADDRIEGGEANRLIFYDRLAKSICAAPLVVKDIQFYYVPDDILHQMSGMKKTEFKPAAAAAQLRCGASELAVSPQGGVTVTVGGKDRFFIESDFSYERTPTMGFNRLHVGNAPGGRSDWRVSVASAGADAVKILAQCADYQVERVLKVEDHRIAVRDFYTNRTARDLGVRWRHTVGQHAPQALANRLAGQRQVSVVKYFGTANPTLFACGGAGAVGLLAEDTVSRAQLELRAAGNVQSMESVGMGIPANGSVTLDWAVYPTPSRDYYDFINAVRRDWKMNYTIDGPYAGHDVNVTFSRSGVKPLPPWHNYNNGAALSDEEFAEKIRPAAEIARAVNPAIKLLGMVETNLVAFDCRTVPWGDRLAQRIGARNQPGVKYGLFMDAETTRLFDEFSPYRDSIIRDAAGNAMYENYYTSKPFVNLMVQPEIGNARYRRFFEQIDFLMDKVGMNGIYIDQFQPYTIGGTSENRWDGHTVELAADGTIARRRYSYAITGAPARAAIIKYVRDKGGIVVTNGQPSSREEQGDGRFAFQEMENDDVNPLKFLTVKPPECPWQVSSHLGTPIALGIRPRRYAAQGARPEQYAQMQTKGIITALRNGLVYYYYTPDITEEQAGICDNMFPFTPVELHEGYVVGRERTVTAVSGRYSMKGNRAPQILYFDCRGMLKPNSFPISGRPGDWVAEIRLDDWNEVAILIRQD